MPAIDPETLARVYDIGRANAVRCGKLLVAAAVTECDCVQGVTATHDILLGYLGADTGTGVDHGRWTITTTSSQCQQ